MIQTAPQMRILVAVMPVDFRKGIDGLAAICRSRLKTDPFLGHVFVFRNKSGTAIKILMYDGQGFWLCQKRLSSGRLRWWPDKGEAPVSCLAAHELQVLMWNGDPKRVQMGPEWKKIQS